MNNGWVYLFDAAAMEVAGKVIRQSNRSLNARLLKKHIMADSSPLQLRILTIENSTRALPREGGVGGIMYWEGYV